MKKGKVTIHNKDGSELFSGEGEIIDDHLELTLSPDVFAAVEEIVEAIELAQDMEEQQVILCAVAEFDRLTSQGYKLDMLSGRYVEG
jgi:hypothetical protein